MPVTQPSADTALPPGASPRRGAPDEVRLSVFAVDAVNDIHSLFHAYRCLESLLAPRGHESEELTLPDRELHALIAALNRPMEEQIRKAQDTSHQLLAHLHCPSP